MPELGGPDGSGALGLELNNFGVDGDGMTIGRVMDWIENRLETIRSEEDDCDVDEDDKRGKARPEEKKPATSARPTRTATKSSLASSDTDSGDQVRPLVVPPLPTATPSVVRITSSQRIVSPRYTSPSLTKSEASQAPQTGSTGSRSRAKVERQLRQSLMAPSPSPSFPLSTDSAQHTPTPNLHNNLPSSGFEFNPVYPENTQAILGSKRRHATMVSEITNTPITNASTTSPNNSPSNHTRTCVPMSAKRRGRGSSQQNPRSSSNADTSDSMDVEDQEPARKRVSRR